MEQPSLLIQLIPMLVIQLPYAFFAGALAKRLNGNTLLWIVLSIIPLLGFLFMLYVFYRIVSRVLDRLDEINTKVAF